MCQISLHSVSSASSHGSLSARNELLLASPEVAIGTNTYVHTPEQARAVGERFIAAVQGLMGQIQAGAKQVRGVSGPLPDVMKGKLEYLNAEQVNAKGMDRAHHWRVSFRQTLQVAPGGNAYAPVSAGQCVVLVGGLPGSRSGGVLGIESNLAAVRETVESDILQYGCEEEVQYASAGDVTADMVAASKQPDMVYKPVQGGVLAPFWLIENGEKPATEEGMGGEIAGSPFSIQSSIEKEIAIVLKRKDRIPSSVISEVDEFGNELLKISNNEISEFIIKSAIKILKFAINEIQTSYRYEGPIQIKNKQIQYDSLFYLKRLLYIDKILKSGVTNPWPLVNDFSFFSRVASENHEPSPVRIALIGFDPFDEAEYLGTRLFIPNNSGLLALYYANKSIEINGKKVIFEISLLPVSWEEFSEGLFDRYFDINDRMKRCTHIFTISKTTTKKSIIAEIDRFAVNIRNTTGVDNSNEKSHKSHILFGKKFFYETKLPYSDLPKLMYCRSGVYMRKNSSGGDLNQDDSHEKRGFVEIPYESPFPSKQDDIVGGSGGNYLSNEAFYRLMHAIQEQNIISGHIHLDGNEEDIEILTDVFEKYLEKIL